MTWGPRTWITPSPPGDTGTFEDRSTMRISVSSTTRPMVPRRLSSGRRTVTTGEVSVSP